MTMKGKQVIMMAMPGARLSTVTSKMSETLVAVSEPSSPSEKDTSCAAAGSARPISRPTVPAVQAIRKSRRSRVIVAPDDFGQPHGKLTFARRFQLGQLAARD